MAEICSLTDILDDCTATLENQQKQMALARYFEPVWEPLGDSIIDSYHREADITAERLATDSYFWGTFAIMSIVCTLIATSATPFGLAGILAILPLTAKTLKTRKKARESRELGDICDIVLQLRNEKKCAEQNRKKKMAESESDEKPQTIGITDANLSPLRIGDVVDMLGMTGTVTFECGAYGIGFDDIIDWDTVTDNIEEYTGCDNRPDFCFNDNFVSFWELLWNFNCEDNCCIVVEKKTDDTN